MALRVLICDERPLVSDGLCKLLESEPDIQVVGTADSVSRAQNLIRTKKPDVVLAGSPLRGISARDLIRRLRGSDEDPRPLIVLHAFAVVEDAPADALRAGAIGLLADNASKAQLVSAVRCVAHGHAVLGPGIAARLLDRLSERAVPANADIAPLLGMLTSREREILLLMASGQSIEDIAQSLYIGVATVRTHIYRLRTKLHLKDRVQLVSFAYQAGLVPDRHVDLPGMMTESKR